MSKDWTRLSTNELAEEIYAELRHDDTPSESRIWLHELIDRAKHWEAEATRLRTALGHLADWRAVKTERNHLRDLVRELVVGLEKYGRHDGTWLCREYGCGVKVPCGLGSLIERARKAVEP